jgi:hypothetical protein
MNQSPRLLTSGLIRSMSRHMRTTVRLEDALLERAKREAARRGLTLTALIERGLRLVLARPEHPKARRRIALPVCKAGGGTLRGVDLNDSARLLDVLEGRL